MLWVGLDDTDVLGHPGTNQLARKLVKVVWQGVCGKLVVRHQLLQDPRVPCTRKNGCAGIEFSLETGTNRAALIAELRRQVLAWCPPGSDPGLCVAAAVPEQIVSFGRRCQSELVTQSEARQLAQQHDIYLQGLGGTEDGVIGALAAVGLLASRDGGRVIYRANFGGDDLHDLSGCHPYETLTLHGVDAVLRHDTGARVQSGTIDLGKRLRPNYRDGRVVLYVLPTAEQTVCGPQWQAIRLT